MNSSSSSERPVQRLRHRLREATSDAILGAAEETLGERGVEATGMAEIAARAGVAVGTLYNHFEDRDALLAALLAERRRELLDRIDGALERHRAEPFRARLVALTKALFDHVEAHRRLFAILLDDQKPMGVGAKTRSPSITEIHGRFEAMMKQGVRDKSLRREHAALYPGIFLGMLKGALIQEQRAKRRISSAALAEAMVAVFLEGAAGR